MIIARWNLQQGQFPQMIQNGGRRLIRCNDDDRQPRHRHSSCERRRIMRLAEKSRKSIQSRSIPSERGPASGHSKLRRSGTAAPSAGSSRPKLAAKPQRNTSVHRRGVRESPRCSVSAHGNHPKSIAPPWQSHVAGDSHNGTNGLCRMQLTLPPYRAINASAPFVYVGLHSSPMHHPSM